MALGYGYVSSYKPPKPAKVPTGSLALAAAGNASASNPFGFQTARNTTGFRDSAAAPVAPTRKPVTAATSPVVAPVARPGVNPTVATPQAPPTPQGYDINTDPSLQGTNALAGLSDEQANAEALKERQHQVLAYGDAGLARSVLGDENIASAAAGNPTSTLAQLGQQHDRNAKTLLDQLNSANLLYSGYRVNQESQAAQDYQNQLAQAAAGVNSNLDTISGNLASTLSGNQAQRLAAEQAARDRAVQLALTAGASGGIGGAVSGTGPQLPGVTAPDTGAIDLGGIFGSVAPSSIAEVAAAPPTDFSFANDIAAAPPAPNAIQSVADTSSPATLDDLLKVIAGVAPKPKSGYASGSGANLH